MEVRKSLKPGAAGTKHLLEKYGEQLVRVRYRYDDTLHKRYTTVELIVDSKEWMKTQFTNPQACQSYYATDVRVKIDYHETELRQKVKAAGGIWLPKDRLWQLNKNLVKKLDIEHRVVNL
ncbi:MAG: hypothetical protein OQL06_15685 [Gammaproteobacteria bacterium]|nr:hypothetical protein [Gammaproteobacteria bacterium]